MNDGSQIHGVDFHCHLDLFPDYEAAIARAEAAQVYTLTVTTTPRAWPRNLELTRDTRYVRAALGLHPQLIVENAAELDLWKKYLHEARYVGEVGLDAGPRFYKSLDLQKQVFQAILEACAEVGGKILTVHSVRSAKAVLDMIEQYMPEGRGDVVLHWFSGSQSEARRAAALGCYFSVNAEMMRSQRGQALVAELPNDRLLTETDGPFTQTDGHPAEPVDVSSVVGALANSRQISSTEMNKIIGVNLKRLIQQNSE